MERENNTCSYTYSATQQAEIRKIYEKYVSKDEDKMMKLRHLDRSVTRIATIVASAVGIAGILSFCLGMSYFFRWSEFSVLGIVIALIGLVAMLVVNPIYKTITEKYRKKLAPEIITLCEEMLV